MLTRANPAWARSHEGFDTGLNGMAFCDHLIGSFTIDRCGRGRPVAGGRVGAWTKQKNWTRRCGMRAPV